MKPASEMTHKQAVRRMANWLQNTMGHTVVIAELTTANAETPDILGFRSGARSMLIEVKISRADFLADKQKRFRVISEAGMGDRRFYAAPKGLLSADEMPAGWGLLEIEDRSIGHTKEATEKEANKRAEVIMLTSAIRRLEIATAVFVRQDDSFLG